MKKGLEKNSLSFANNVLILRGDTSGTFKVASSPFFAGVNERPHSR